MKSGRRKEKDLQEWKSDFFLLSLPGKGKTTVD
jgi:hypothetical protein